MPVFKYNTQFGPVEVTADTKEQADADLAQALRFKTMEAGPGAMAPTAAKQEDPLSAVTDSYIVDRLKRAVSTMAGNVAAVNPALATENPLLRGQAPSREQAAAQTAQALDFKGLRAGSDIEKIAGEAAATAVDPTTYAMGPGGVIRRGLLGGVAGGGAEAGAIMAATEPGTAADLLARVAGAGAASLGTSAGSAGLGVAGRPAVQYAKQLISPQGQQQAVQELEKQASSHIQNVLREAVKLDPQLVPKIQMVMLDAQKFGVRMPISALADNEVIDAALRGLAARDPQFAGLYQQEFAQAKEQLRQAKEGMFGDPAKAAELLSQRTAYQTPQQRAELEARLREQQAKESNLALERQATGMTQKAFPFAEREADMTTRLTRVADEDLRISPAASKQYEDVAKLAADDGSSLSSQSAAELHALATATKEENLFTSFPSLIDRIKNVTKPKADGGFEAIDYQNARGLQQEINKLLRSDAPDASKYYLSQLKTRLETMMYEDMPQHAQLLRDANQRFAYDANLKDFAMSAIDSKTGMLNPEKAAAWIASNRGAIDNISAYDPVLDKALNLRSGIVDPALNIARVLDQRVKAENIVGKMRVDDWVGDAGMSPKTLVNKILGDPAFAKKALERFRTDPEGMKALKSYILDEAMGGETPAATFAKFMDNKDSKLTLERLFGSGAGGFLNTVEKLGSVSDKLLKSAKDAQTRYSMTSVKKDKFEELFGVPLSMIFSKLRNPIISGPQAAVELLSKGITAKQAEHFDKQLKELLLDPQKFATFVKDLDAAASSGNLEAAAKALQSRGLTFAQETLSGVGKAGILGGMQQQIKANEPAEVYQ